MRAGMCLNALYMILLKWELVCVWMRFIWYYWNDSMYVSECALYDNIKIVAGMSECALYDIIKMRAGMCVNGLYMIL